MKPRLIDRLLIITLCLDLVLVLWCLFISYPAHSQVLLTVY